jgi:hypothetical protein
MQSKIQILGNDSDARVVLKNLLTIRNVDGAYLDAMSELHCKKEIYLQTRIEFGVKERRMEKRNSNNYQRF